MKKLFLLSALFLCLTTFVEAQKISRYGPIPYSTQVPTSRPTLSQSQVWFNTTNATFYIYDRATASWDAVAKKPRYAEMSISNDTTSISFAATTATQIQDLTAGPLSGFTMLADSALRYDGVQSGTFLVNYSASVSFAEAANILNGYPVIGTTPVLRAKFRQTATLTADRVNVSGTALITLTPGQTVRFMFFPSAHTGTDDLTIYEFNLNLTEIR